MFDFDVGKLLLVAVLALVVLGPDKLPRAARTAGVMLRRLRTGWDSVRTEVEQQLQLEELRTAATQARTGLQALGDATGRQLRAARDATIATAGEVAAAVKVANEDDGASGVHARPGCTPEDIEGIAERARVEMDNIRRIADRQVAAARARTDEARAGHAVAPAAARSRPGGGVAVDAGGTAVRTGASSGTTRGAAGCGDRNARDG